ncbi:MAG: adenosylcobinamide-phosphate synthase CbiB [Phocaeicola sp.]
MDIELLYMLLPLLLGWSADRIWGDPPLLPHPIVGFGKLISWGEKRWNRGNFRKLKGALLSIGLIASCFLWTHLLSVALAYINLGLNLLFCTILLFFCLAGKGLIDEVRQVFIAVDSSVEEGRIQVARIVGRDTSALSPQQIRTAALETASENLSDGVVAPLFWFMLLGIPGMLTYKMINTLDSMIGYKSDRYKEFGCWAAQIDDVANYLPARLTAFLMILVTGHFRLFTFVRQYSHCHASPNSGYPESALAAILDCRFGGPNLYFGERVDKPYIGRNTKQLTTADMEVALAINRKVEVAMVLLVILVQVTFYSIF